MKPIGSEAPRTSINVHQEGPNWILVAGGALLSALSFRLGYKLKQSSDTNKQSDNGRQSLEANEKSAQFQMAGNCHMHSSAFCFPQEDSCCNGYTRSGNVEEINQENMTKSALTLPLGTVPSCEFRKENGVMWSSSTDHLELPQKPFNHSNCSETSCVLESGSDIFSRREVIQKLRQQLKRRDDTILEMQEQISELQNSLSTQLSQSSHLQSLLDATNRELFSSEREVRRLRKAIAKHCVGHINSSEKSPTVPVWPVEGMNGHANGYSEVETKLDSSNIGRGDGENTEVLKREIRELKDLIEGKDYLLQSYKEQKSELEINIKELQQRLDSQLPNIL